jgi:hypothetical protein
MMFESLFMVRELRVGHRRLEGEGRVKLDPKPGDSTRVEEIMTHE